MLDFNNSRSRIGIVNQEDRALLRSNPSAWLMPEDGREHIVKYMLLSSCSSFGHKAINLLIWCEAPTKVNQIENGVPVGHMSAYLIRCFGPLLKPEDLAHHANIDQWTINPQVFPTNEVRIYQNAP
jgi:hypothetical protein